MHIETFSLDIMYHEEQIQYMQEKKERTLYARKKRTYIFVRPYVKTGL